MIIQNRFKIQQIIEGPDKENYVEMMFNDRIIRKIPNESKITLVEQPIIILGDKEDQFVFPTYIWFDDIIKASSLTVFIPMYYCDDNNIFKSIITEQLEVIYRDQMYMLLKYSQIKDNDYYSAPTILCFEHDVGYQNKIQNPCTGIIYENIIKYDYIVSLDNDLRMLIDFESCKTMADTGDKICETCKFNPNDANYTCHDVNLEYEYPRKSTVYPKDIESIPRYINSNMDPESRVIHTKIVRQQDDYGRYKNQLKPCQVYLDIKMKEEC